MNESKGRVRSPDCPCYSRLRALIPILVGVHKSDVTHMCQSIVGNVGTPKNPLDWSDPVKWIAERLTGDDAALAGRVWEESKHVVNPRYLTWSYRFLYLYGLIAQDDAGLFALTEAGRGFLDDEPATIRDLDNATGLFALLRILATKTKAKRGDMLPEWWEFMQENSTYTAPSVVSNALYERLKNLVERGLVSKEGNSYDITEAGLLHIKETKEEKPDPKQEVLRAVKDYNIRQREALREALGNMPPYHFEGLIGMLLEAMGYEDVTVTKQAGDKGVDVVATIQYGITTVCEVVQVKRHTKGSVGRPVIDQLRGALPYHRAIRGTLITLGGISKGAAEAAVFLGAAPITLIDGDKLLDLLVEHDLGIRKRELKLWELDVEDLAETLDSASEEGELQRV